MTKTTTPTARWDRYDGRWVVNGDHLDYPVALKVLIRAGMPHGDAVNELERAHRAARPTILATLAAEAPECTTVALPETATWSASQGTAEIFQDPGDLYPVLRIEVPSEEAAVALLQAARSVVRHWGVDQ